jgi:hypothetical protein
MLLETGVLEGHEMLQVNGDKLTYKLSLLESLGAFSKSPRNILSNIKEIKFVENPWSKEVLRGVRAPGTGIPFVIMLGTMRHRKGKDFCVVYKKRPVIVIEFQAGPYSRWVIPDTSNTRALLNKSINQAR